ncbi:unnamed protein product, partial [Medioppia subpectinata]
MERQRVYQACTEIGWFVTTDLPNSPFGHNIPVEFYIQQCADVFGPQFTAQTVQKGVDRTNAKYGGLKPNVTNVVFPNGSLDPYHALSVLKDLNKSTKAVMIEGCAHGGDMWGSTPKDSQRVIRKLRSHFLRNLDPPLMRELLANRWERCAPIIS